MTILLDGLSPLRWIGATFGTAILIVLAVAAVSASETATEDTWIDWATDRALILDPVEWPETMPEELGPITDALDGTRVVFLGESDHYSAEKYDYRLLLIRALFERGYRHLGMEMGLSDGMRVDRYLETGDERHLDRVATYGYRGDVRPDRESVPRPLEAVAEQPFFDAFIAEERAFLRQLRAINASLGPGEERLHWFGWDIDATYPGGGYAEARTILGQHHGTPVVDEVLARLALVPTETFTAEAERLEGVLALMADREVELLEALGPADAHLLRHVVRNLVDSLNFGELAFREPFGRYWNEALQRREEALIGRLDDGWLTRLDPSSKVILMGHNMHLGKDPSSLRSGPADGDATVGMWPSVGSAVAARLPVYAFWMLYDHGTSVRAFAADPVFSVPSHPDRVEHLLARIAPVLVLPLGDDDPRAAWLDEDRNFVQNGDYASGRLRRQADAIFFVEEVTVVGS
jgi:erythromycin esterase-like protein